MAQQEVDDAQGKDLAAGSNLDAVKGMLDTAKSEVAVAQARLAHDQAMFDYSRITAPFDGVVTQRYRESGRHDAGRNQFTRSQRRWCGCPRKMSTGW